MDEIEVKCTRCRDEYPAEYVTDGVCCFCRDKARFAAFARSAGLERFPEPDGERYVYNLDGTCAGKKGECVHFMDELWNALVRAKGGGEDLLLKDGAQS